MPKKRLIAAFLVLFLGFLGIHRFYVGKIGTGLLQLLTFGGAGIWWGIDIVFIFLGEFKDINGNKLRAWL
jgi:TM2 domain-containing membrane protein YozV